VLFGTIGLLHAQASGYRPHFPRAEFGIAVCFSGNDQSGERAERPNPLENSAGTLSGIEARKTIRFVERGDAWEACIRGHKPVLRLMPCADWAARGSQTTIFSSPERR